VDEETSLPDGVLRFRCRSPRHTIPLLQAASKSPQFEYENAFKRPVAGKKRTAANRFGHFEDLVWPHDFIRSREKYDVVILAYVLQTVPEKKERDIILKEIAKKLDPNGPRRLYYASRFGDRSDADKLHLYKDGYIRKLDNQYQTFYTEWSLGETERFMKKRKFEPDWRLLCATQAYIFEYQPRRML